MRLLAPKYGLWIIFLIVLVIEQFDICSGLKCWHCIAEDCHDDPSENLKATKTECKLGQVCQKVYFEMFSPDDNREYTSTVRACSQDCLPQNDFQNCSKELKFSRGCVRRNCCSDTDLCNTSSKLSPQFIVAASLCLIFCRVL